MAATGEGDRAQVDPPGPAAVGAARGVRPAGRGRRRVRRRPDGHRRVPDRPCRRAAGGAVADRRHRRGAVLRARPAAGSYFERLASHDVALRLLAAFASASTNASSPSHRPSSTPTGRATCWAGWWATSTRSRGSTFAASGRPSCASSSRRRRWRCPRRSSRRPRWSWRAGSSRAPRRCRSRDGAWAAQRVPPPRRVAQRRARGGAGRCPGARHVRRRGGRDGSARRDRPRRVRLSRRKGLAAGVTDGLGIAITGATVAGVLAVAVTQRSAGTSTACWSRRWRFLPGVLRGGQPASAGGTRAFRDPGGRVAGARHRRSRAAGPAIPARPAPIPSGGPRSRWSSHRPLLARGAGRSRRREPHARGRAPGGARRAPAARARRRSRTCCSAFSTR